MADSTATSPADMDPIQQAQVGVSASNIKTFGDLQLQYANLSLGNAVAGQQRNNSFTMALLGRVTDFILDKTANTVANAVIDQEDAKIAMTTPPDTSGSLASLAAQVSALTQMIQGLNISKAAVAVAKTAAVGVPGQATPAAIAAATTKV